MGKRSDGTFERRENDTYDTPFKAVVPLIAHLPKACYFIEPCAGAGDLVDHLEKFGHTCIAKFDIEPRRADIARRSAFALRVKSGNPMIITNPPWTREIMHPMLAHLASQAPTWALFDADWCHTKQAAGLLPICHKIVSVGRVKWIEGSDQTGKDNAAWHLFDASYRTDFIKFYGRQP